ncbi:hypothetical protein IAU60_000154 [Kwoniella sp. DSM 27419]
MYSGGHQRSSSNPRAYAAPDANALGGRRDDAAPQSLYGAEDGYGAYQQHTGGYAGMSNVGYGGYNSGVNLAGYGTTSPSAPSGSRRTSGPKMATPPQPATTATNPSPSSQYYQRTSAQASDPGHHQSPYQPSSAPPQALSHHQSGMSSQPQTAHPYANQYQHYYEQNQHPTSQSQWANYPSSGYSQQSTAPRSAAPSATTPTVSSSATMGDGQQHRASGPSGTAGYDYSGSTGAYSNWPTHDPARGQQSQQSWQQPQSGSNRSSQSQQGQPAMMQQGAWQGYGGHPSMHQTMPPHHMAAGHMPPGQYGWQQQWGSQGYGYPPAPVPHAQNMHAQPPPVPAQAPAVTVDSAKPGKKSKKDKGDKPDKAHKGEKLEDYKGLGKRAVESSTEEEVEEKKEGKKKKGKKEEEKPVPKPPAKSHLHPPRQAQSAWQLFFTDELNKAKAAAAQGNSPGGTPHHAKLNVAQIAKDAGIAYANLDNEQKKYYAQKVQESKDQYAQELAIWQATLTPEDIKAENAFRAQQRKEGKSRKGNLKDPNAPKKPLSAYFLFLKGIRENDDIRAKVWGEESETTKQSVLAAERWRSLTDDEKKPYLQQAEQDKQEYEAARKIYEDEAAARARGEVSSRSAPDADVAGISGLPKEEKHDLESGEHPSSDTHQATSPEVKATVSSDPNFPDFQQGDSRGSASNTPAHVSGQGGEYDQSMEMDEFSGFADPLTTMDLTGLEGMAAGAGVSHEPQWDELQKLMGTTDDGYDGGSEEKPEQTTTDVSVAPALGDAVGQSTVDLQQQPLQTESHIQGIAAQAEGTTAVPQVVPLATEGSGIPTEAVNELPPAGVSLVDDSVPSIQSSSTSQDSLIMPAVDGM